jgi:hypothetical protein
VRALLWGRVWEVYINVPQKLVAVREIWLKFGWTGFKFGWTGSLADLAGDWTGLKFGWTGFKFGSTGFKFGWTGFKIRLNRIQIWLNRIQNSVEPVFQKSAHDFFWQDWVADWQWQRGTVQKPVEPVLGPVEPVFELLQRFWKTRSETRVKWKF